MKAIFCFALACYVLAFGARAQLTNPASTAVNAPGGSLTASNAVLTAINRQQQLLLNSQALTAGDATNSLASLQASATNSLLMSTLANSAQATTSAVQAPTPAPPPASEIELQPDGALARFGPHRVKFMANASAGVEIQLPGSLLRTHVIGLCYYSPATGESVMIAEPKESVGEVLPPNRVIYRQAIEGCDLVFTYTATSFEQDLVIRTNLPDPAVLGLRGPVRLAVLTELSGPAHPRRVPGSVDLRAKNQALGVQGEEVLPDETLWFGSFRIAGGKSFALGGNGPEVPSAKSFQIIEGRQFLIEFTPYALIKAQIDSLPAGALQSKAHPRRPLKSMLAQLAPPAANSLPTGTMRLSRDPSDLAPGVVLDYLMVTEPLINVNFAADPGSKVGPAAVGHSESDYWNGYWFPGQNLVDVSGLVYSDRTVSPVGMTVANAPGGWGGFCTDPMYNGYVYNGYGANITITLNNLPPNHYNLYLYGHDGDPAHNGIYQLSSGGTVLGLKGNSIWGPGSLSTNWQPGQQYVVFTNIGVTTQDLVIDVIPNSAGYPYISGLQLVPTEAVPPDGPSVESLINLDFGSDPSGKTGPAAAGQSGGDYWNGYSPSQTGIDGISNLKDATGAATQAGVVVLNAFGAGAASNDDPMYNFSISSWDSGNITLLVTNLSSGNYDFYLYGHDGWDPGANCVFQLWTGGRDCGVKGTSIYGTAWSTTSWEENEQFVRFRDVAVTAGQPVTILAGHHSEGWANINGMQIVYKGPADVDGNGLPDAWEQHYFGQTGVVATEDPDGDGLSNLQEYLLGTCPTNPDTDNNGVRDGADRELVWINNAIPAGGYALKDNDEWNWMPNFWDGDGWDGNWLEGYPGRSMHVSDLVSGNFLQHYFSSSVVNVMVNTGDVLYAYVNLDSSHLPGEAMLQWYVTDENGNGSWEHRAYWGADALGWGTAGTESRHPMGPLPDAGTWVRLEVPAAAVGLEGKVLQGMAFTLFSGRAAWDRAGKLLVPPSLTVTPQSQSANEGATATFCATVAGCQPMTYQWTLNGNDIPGATGSCFTTGELGMSANGGAYAVRVANPFGSTTSPAATLTVTECDAAAHPLAVTGLKTTCEDKMRIDVINLTGADLAGGHFDLDVYFDGVNRTFFRALQPWGPSDVLPAGGHHLLIFCAPDHSITNFDCIVVYRGNGTCAASPKFRILTRDDPARLVKNTTLIANPCIECGNCSENAPPWVTPLSRAEYNPNLGPVPCPVAPWPPSLPTTSSAGGASKHMDNFYQLSDPAEYSGYPGCPKSGFKNVYASKNWHGVLGPRSGIWGRVAAMQGNCGCSRVPVRGLTVDTTKYLRVSGTATNASMETYQGVPAFGSTSVSRASLVDRYTGNRTYTESHSGFVGPPAGIPELHLADLPNIYCATVSDYLQYLSGHWVQTPAGDGTITPTFIDGEHPSMEWNYEWSFSITNDYCTVTKAGHNRGFVRLDLVAGTFSCSVDLLSTFYPECIPSQATSITHSESEDISVGETEVSDIKTLSDEGAGEELIESWNSIVTYSDPYTSDQVNTDCDGLLAQWNLLDDIEYPWRDDGGVNRGPLVTYNERPATAPTLGFGMVNAGTEEQPNWQPLQDVSLPPWPSQPEGAILGAPLPPRGPTGEICTNEPYFNFYHANWTFRETEVGSPEAFIASRGDFSPFPNATQWVDDLQAQIFPGGPFCAYGAANGHFSYALKNPNITDTEGNYEQGGYGPYLLKCKWAETLTAPAPPGSDVLFKQWNFDFRDFLESYNYCSAAWSRNHFEPGCPGIDPGSPVRYTPDISSGGYDVGPGSYWVSDMSCQSLHYDYNCCQPAVYIQPNTPGPDCTSSGVFVPMPPAVCDEQYGSLWMGRVDQRNTDPHDCDNYVANRNSGLPNSAACDPQIELDLVSHGGAVDEIFVAPLDFVYGAGEPVSVTVRIDIARKNQNVPVPQDQKRSNGSVVQVVPQANPGNLYPGGIFLNIPTLTVDPISLADQVILKLRKIGPPSNQGKIRVYKQPPGAAYAVFLDENTQERIVRTEDLTCPWKLDSTTGGVVDLALIAESLDGTELARDWVRVSSIPCDPADGRIVFVNPASSLPAAPYDNFLLNAAHSIADAIATMQANDNILIAQSTYHENNLTVTTAGGIAGLAGRWTISDPALGTDASTPPLDEYFDMSNLPVLNALGLPLGSILHASSINSGFGLGVGGLVFTNGRAADSSFPVINAGGALRLDNITIPLRIRFCRFDRNSATDFGGAVYLQTVPDAKLRFCAFTQNKAEHDDGGLGIVWSGMGGAVALDGSMAQTALILSESTFLSNTGRITSAGGAPFSGSAGGGGDVFLRQASLTFNHSRSVNAVAGFPRVAADADSYYFTGDGGAILVEGNLANSLQIANSRFTGSASFGNGGAISLSYDSSPQGRKWFVLKPNYPLPTVDPQPVQLSGACSGTIANSIFELSLGGWQGGAIAINGTGMHLSLVDCTFTGCQAGTIQSRDGKGGAIAVCGGLQSSDPPLDDIHLSHCTITGCSCSGNGGGLYATIRASVSLENGCSVDQCTALNGAGVQFAKWEGFGGGLHASAGASLGLADGTSVTGNSGVSAGGVGAKSATLQCSGVVEVRGNAAKDASASGYGNGGGILVSTSFYDDGPLPPGPGWGAALIFSSDGSLYSSASGTLTIENNLADRSGGGIYAGISPPWWDPSWHVGNHDSCAVGLNAATVQNNQASGGVIVGQSVLNNTQVTAERVQNDYFTTAAFSLQNVTITGGQLDIGVYLKDSITASMVNVAFPNLANPLVTQP